MYYIYKRKPMSKWDFNKVAKQGWKDASEEFNFHLF